MSRHRLIAALGAIPALALTACATAPETAPAASAAAPAQADEPRVPATMQWLYGSGEAAATSIQTYRAFRDYVVGATRARPANSVILEAGSTLDSPRFAACGQRPLAVVLDVDETVIQNLGIEYDEAVHPGRPFSEDRWRRWEETGTAAVAPIPGAVSALRDIRGAGVAVIFNTNRTAANASHTRAMIEGAGLGPARHGETLYLQGDVAPGSGKDPRRAAIAQRYCVVALAGDQLGDFSDLFNVRTLPIPDRRRAASAAPFAGLWGNGWFMLSNPVYGPSIRGSFDDVFPADKRWSDPQGEN